MAVKTKAQLKALWQTGYRPEQQDYHDLFDSVLLQNVSGTGTAVEFVQDKVYGTMAAPESGNITASYTDANVGTTILIIHQNGTEPTYPATWQKLTGSQPYSTTMVNYIRAEYLDSNHVKYTIRQDA